MFVAITPDELLDVGTILCVATWIDQEEPSRHAVLIEADERRCGHPQFRYTIPEADAQDLLAFLERARRSDGDGGRMFVRVGPWRVVRVDTIRRVSVDPLPEAPTHRDVTIECDPRNGPIPRVHAKLTAADAAALVETLGTLHRPPAFASPRRAATADAAG